MHNNIIIFTDGSALNNPGKAGWGAVLVFDKKEILEIGGFEKKSTNNRMEMTSAIESLRILEKNKGINNKTQIIINTDSSYLFNGITKWVSGWVLKNWIGANKNPVLNKDLWEKLMVLNNKFKIEWKLLPGHSGIIGNERADEIATSFASEDQLILYKGTIEKYKKNILDFKTNGTNDRRKKMKAYSYLSMIEGIIKKHKTWAECESRIKGKKDAKFRKSIDKDDEKKIIDGWRNENCR
ncbi:ribonuclease HI [Patescibacteria group bacterium]|nr:ribonuclease HI [Patescibacteria group bacterium]MBU4115619.1 ribonuclease HI [Patescibacteria group bacterium]